ncbi:hypothetical protein V5P93_003930 [Actinokineospora auranticolor]|uniref:Helix-turn-helix protein n=1 Tax=Actinokineospora auranticolor TaxID=155976 RepID=A0A2S6GLU6_9PSEU|nr:hypothetical protein [Actinokineospora auranticolor]PPK66212.1 hypothetical protein CLV40_111176 [Actinokineospora auranticolor]
MNQSPAHRPHTITFRPAESPAQAAARLRDDRRLHDPDRFRHACGGALFWHRKILLDISRYTVVAAIDRPLDSTTLRHYEHGRVAVSVGRFAQVCAALGERPDAMLREVLRLHDEAEPPVLWLDPRRLGPDLPPSIAGWRHRRGTDPAPVSLDTVTRWADSDGLTVETVLGHLRRARVTGPHPEPAPPAFQAAPEHRPLPGPDRPRLNRELGRWLKDMRTANALTRTGLHNLLVHRAGMTLGVRRLEPYEGGHRAMTLLFLVRCARLLGADPCDALGTAFDASTSPAPTSTSTSPR